MKRMYLFARVLAFAAAFTATAACQSFLAPYTTETYVTDESDVYRMADNYLGGAFLLPGTFSFYSAQLNLQRTELRDGAVVFSFHARLYDLEYPGIEAGESLVVTLDGQPFAFSGQGGGKLRKPRSEDEDEEFFEESAYWHGLEGPFLGAMYEAREIRIQIKGATRTYHYFATDKNRSNFRRFLKNNGPSETRQD